MRRNWKEFPAIPDAPERDLIAPGEIDVRGDLISTVDIEGDDDADETVRPWELWIDQWHPPVGETVPVGGPSWEDAERARGRLYKLYRARMGFLKGVLRDGGKRCPSDTDAAMLRDEETERARLLKPRDMADAEEEHRFLREAAGVDGRPLMRGDLTPAAIVEFVERTVRALGKRRATGKRHGGARAVDVSAAAPA